MKKWLGILLTFILVLNLFPAIGEEADSAVSAEEQEYWVSYDYNDLTIGNPTQMNGQFFTALWGSNTSDIDVRQLITGYNLIRWDGDMSVFRFDHTVVSGAAIGDDQNGNRRYLVSLYKDLYYSDGTRINAWDYAFSVLFQASPLIEKLGGIPADLSYLVGYEDYAEGRTKTLKGLRVIDDYQIVFTVKKEALPYFYELSRFSFTPYPISTVAPGCRVYDSEEGAYIAGEDPETDAFTEELLRQTILTADTGYQIHPVPGSGPYTIESFDGETARFVINPWYKGDEDGSKPKIKQLTYTLANNEDMIAGLKEGKYALLNKVTLAETIRQGLELCTNSNQYIRTTYPRTGLTYFYFLPGSSMVQSGKLRQALANCLDRNRFVDEYVGYFGVESYGLYGLGQWMYQLAAGIMPYPENGSKNQTTAVQAEDEESSGWESITLDGLTRYSFDPEKAAALLDEDGWNLNEQGDPFVPGTDAVRCRQTEAGLKPLELTIAYTGASEVKQPLTAYFLDNLVQVGIKPNLVSTTLSRIEEVFDGSIDEAYDLIYLGNNFSFVFNPSLIFSSGAARKQEGVEQDSLPAVHAELRDLALEMDRTEPTDTFSYMQKWVGFQERLSETLPILPVYINVYFDFYTRELNNYWIADHTTWGNAIVAARMSRGTVTDKEMEGLLEDYNNVMNNGTAADAASFSAEHQVKTGPDASAGALAGFPREIQDQIPEAYRTINEFITVQISDDYQNVKSARIQFSFQTRYPAGDPVYLIFGAATGNGTEWIVREAEVLENGSVSVELQKEQLDKLAGQPVPLVVVSKQ